MCAVRADTEPRAEVLPQGPEARPGRRAAADAPTPPLLHGAAELGAGGREQRGRRAIAARGAPARAGRRAARSVRRRRCSRLHQLEQEQPRSSPCSQQQWQVPFLQHALELQSSGSGFLTMFQNIFQRCNTAWTGQVVQLQVLEHG